MLKLRKNMASHSDEELLALYRTSGDTAWLGALFERYMEWVYGLCLRYADRPEDAQDAVMGIFEALITKAREHEIQFFKSWLFVFARNYCLMRIRKQGRQAEVIAQLENISPTYEEAWEPDDSAEAQLRLQHCLEQLSLAQRDCILLFYYQDHSYQTIAQQRQEALGQVRSHLQNGKRNLRLCMDGSSSSR